MGRLWMFLRVPMCIGERDLSVTEEGFGEGRVPSGDSVPHVKGSLRTDDRTTRLSDDMLKEVTTLRHFRFLLSGDGKKLLDHSGILYEEGGR